jgi:hypothetical protein
MYEPLNRVDEGKKENHEKAVIDVKPVTVATKKSKPCLTANGCDPSSSLMGIVNETCAKDGDRSVPNGRHDGCFMQPASAYYE